MGAKMKYNEAWKALIQPQRFNFDQTLLGPPETQIDMIPVKNRKFRIKNEQDNFLEGNFYHPIIMPTPIDVVIYLHTRGGCRLEGLFLKNVLLPRIGLVIFDFAGSGYSEGEYITLGHQEAIDTLKIIKHIRSVVKVNKIILWGRSMGAVTAILAASQDKENSLINCLILDSPFSCFKTMIHDVIAANSKIPKCFVNMALFFILKTVKKKIGIDLRTIKPIKEVKNLQIPCFFIVGKDDEISRPDKVKDLYIAYKVPGAHATVRENNILVYKFKKKTL